MRSNAVYFYTLSPVSLYHLHCFYSSVSLQHLLLKLLQHACFLSCCNSASAQQPERSSQWEKSDHVSVPETLQGFRDPCPWPLKPSTVCLHQLHSQALFLSFSVLQAFSLHLEHTNLIPHYGASIHQTLHLECLLYRLLHGCLLLNIYVSPQISPPQKRPSLTIPHHFTNYCTFIFPPKTCHHLEWHYLCICLDVYCLLILLYCEFFKGNNFSLFTPVSPVLSAWHLLGTQ